MSANPEGDAIQPAILENYKSVLDALSEDVKQLHLYKDMFFENHSLDMAKDKNDMILKKRDEVGAKFEEIEESCIPTEKRAQFLYLKGRCLNISPTYDHRALECLNKAVKLDPSLVEAWNELGECYWKNLNLKEARACFEGALNQNRTRVTLRSLSIILRQESTNKSIAENKDTILRSIALAKEAVDLDPLDGQSWSVLGNAYLCEFFLLTQLPTTVKQALSAYKQAWHDPIAKGHPDLHYNKGMALKYEECYGEAIESFKMANRLDPTWKPPINELKDLVGYLNYVSQLLKNKGKIKAKKITEMVKSMDQSMFGYYHPGSLVTVHRRKVTMKHMKIGHLQNGANPEKVILGRVVGSLHSKNSVPFTFALVDESMTCIAVNVYNWADGCGVIIGDCVAIPEPTVTAHDINTSYPEVLANETFFGSQTGNNRIRKTDLVYNFNTIRINDPTNLRVNGKRVGLEEYARTRVSSTYEAH